MRAAALAAPSLGDEQTDMLREKVAALQRRIASAKEAAKTADKVDTSQEDLLSFKTELAARIDLQLGEVCRSAATAIGFMMPAHGSGSPPTERLGSHDVAVMAAPC